MEIYLADTKYETAEEITQNGYALHRDFQMGILDIDIGMPTLWSHTINVPGNPEIIDFSDVLNDGIPTFKDRKMTITLDQEERERWHKKAMDFAKKVHGKKFNIMCSMDDNHFFCGRIILDAKHINSLFNQYTLSITCNPYRYILPLIREDFINFVPDNPSLSSLYDYYFGDYCGEISAEYINQSAIPGSINIYDDRSTIPIQTVTIPSGTGKIYFLPKVHGNVRISFTRVNKITMDGSNLEV